jgi:hypothetical protein
MGDVNVAIDQTRQHGRLRKIDHLGAGRGLKSLFDAHDPIVVNEDRNVGAWRHVDPVDQSARVHNNIAGKGSSSRQQKCERR